MESDDEPMLPPPESPQPPKDNTTFDETVIVKEKEIPIRKEPKVSLSPVREGKWSNILSGQKNGLSGSIYPRPRQMWFHQSGNGLLWSFLRSYHSIR